MEIIIVPKTEYELHIAQSEHTYVYYRIQDATLEVISTLHGVFQASFVSKIPTTASYGLLDELKAIKLLCTGSPFQLNVWQAVLTISTGNTITYQDIAHRIGHTQAYRAVGTALGKNRIAYLIPCHRVVKKDGALGNYRWGREIKEALLRFEKGILK